MRAFTTRDTTGTGNATGEGAAPGHRTLTQQLQRKATPSSAPAPLAPAAAPALAGEGEGDVDDPFALHLGAAVQRAAGPGAITDDPERVHSLAAAGVAGAGGALPHADAIARSFGPAHDVSGIGAFVGGDAAGAASAIGAEAYATGSKVAFRSSPDLHTAAHEAAHVVQQRAGVHLRGGVGEEGDAHERHADAVADRVVRGESAADLLGGPQGGAGGGAVQRQVAAGGAAAAHEQAQAADGAGGGEGAPAEPGSIAAQVAAGGIHVVLARLSVEEDIPPMAQAMMRPNRQGQAPTIGAVLHSLRPQIGESAEFTRLASLPPDQALTMEQATALATAKYRNNREFMNQAPRAARARNAVGGSPDAPQLGAAIAFRNTEDPLALVEAMSVAVQHLAPAAAPGAAPAAAPGAAPAPAGEAPNPSPAPAGAAPSSAPNAAPNAAPAAAAAGRPRRPRHVVPQTHNIAEISIFTHGSHGAIELGSLGWANAGTVSGRLSPLLSSSVRINLYACSAASGDGSFAEQLAENLARDESSPHAADVFGHTTYGNTATLSAGRQFHADAGANAEASSATNWAFIFDDGFIQEQGQAISTALTGEGIAAATPEAVVAAIRDNRVGPLWLATSMRDVMLEMPGGPRGGSQRLQASFAIGMEPERARDAVRAYWRQPDQGTARVRDKLTGSHTSHRGHGHGHGHGHH